MDPLSPEPPDIRSPEERPQPPHRAPQGYVSMGALIGFGAALGLIFGLALDNLVLGMIIGAALGTVAGAVFESYRKR
jgi:uncharacterized membrane protein